MGCGRWRRKDACEPSMEACEGKDGEILRSLVSRGCEAVRLGIALPAVVVSGRTKGKRGCDKAVVTAHGHFVPLEGDGGGVGRRGACGGARAGSTATQTDIAYRQVLIPACADAASETGSGSPSSKEASSWTPAEETCLLRMKKGWEHRIVPSWTNFSCDSMTSAAEMGANMACRCYLQHPVDATCRSFYTI